MFLLIWIFHLLFRRRVKGVRIIYRYEDPEYRDWEGPR